MHIRHPNPAVQAFYRGVAWALALVVCAAILYLLLPSGP